MRYDNADQSIEYTRELFTTEGKDLQEISQDLSEQERRMQLGPEEAKILFVLLRAINAKNIIEIGTLAGYSAIWMAKALPADGKIFCIESNQDRIPIIKKNAQKYNVSEKISIHEGKALDVLPSLEKHAPFDMIFIDADKGNYSNYLKWAENNIRKKGLIVGDNTFLFGSVYQKEKPQNISKNSWIAMQEFNRRLSDPSKYSSIILPAAEGMTIAVKEF